MVEILLINPLTREAAVGLSAVLSILWFLFTRQRLINLIVVPFMGSVDSIKRKRDQADKLIDDQDRLWKWKEERCKLLYDWYKHLTTLTDAIIIATAAYLNFFNARVSLPSGGENLSISEFADTIAYVCRSSPEFSVISSKLDPLSTAP